LHAAEENQCDLVPMLGNLIQDVLFTEDKLALTRSHLDQSVI
jgi:hypothetical protein